METTFVLLRAESFDKILTSLSDMKRYGDLKIIGKPKVINEEFAETILKKTLKEEVKIKFNANVIASVEGEGGLIIDRLRKIHPPAHMIAITNKNELYFLVQKSLKDFEFLKGYTKPKVKL
ncbi:MAG: hypothetical protein AMQ74_01529 [Candidatus Methanofastidiosum methylothiophilum]|uniref:DUF356 domain-containing protein n=1 Tax=Candidatus Methanofastidiosum methylothiophilum TaxID=1705564 RepID=A0A150IV98_9EURY|nr:MAG: hypothetical protein AMQ74_01529 [Candidatus Methanofastidiosum methylthiophilus]